MIDDDNRHITLDEVRKFLIAKGVDITCPSCRKQALQFNEDDPGRSTIFVSAPTDSFNMLDSKAISLILLFCSNCGFVRSYLRRIINQWLRTR